MNSAYVFDWVVVPENYYRILQRLREVFCTAAQPFLGMKVTVSETMPEDMVAIFLGSEIRILDFRPKEKK